MKNQKKLSETKLYEYKGKTYKNLKELCEGIHRSSTVARYLIRTGQVRKLINGVCVNEQ